MGPGPVTTYTIPRLLIAYTQWMMVSATTAVAPHAAIYHFGSEGEKQQQLFLLGGRYVKREVRGFSAAMYREGVAVGRPFPPLNTMLRVTIGNDADMQRFRPAFLKVYSA